MQVQSAIIGNSLEISCQLIMCIYIYIYRSKPFTKSFTSAVILSFNHEGLITQMGDTHVGVSELMAGSLYLCLPNATNGLICVLLSMHCGCKRPACRECCNNLD
jgi:hypothetical protein